MGIIFGRDLLERCLSPCFYFGASRRRASVYVFTFLSSDPGVVGHMDAAPPADGFTFCCRKFLDIAETRRIPTFATSILMSNCSFFLF